jgi:hypothetical protein
VNSSVTNEAVYFIITNIEHDVPSSMQSEAPDMYLGATLGELGCWIDTSITRMIQTGVEHMRVPHTLSYIGTGKYSLALRICVVPNGPDRISIFRDITSPSPV